MGTSQDPSRTSVLSEVSSLVASYLSLSPSKPNIVLLKVNVFLNAYLFDGNQSKLMKKQAF